MVLQSPDEALIYSVIGAFYEVNNVLGFGFPERIYIQALEYELRERGHRVGREVGVIVRYKHLDLGHLRLDMLIDEKLIVETKSSLLLHSSATRQVYNYLCATSLESGLVLHFGPRPQFYKVLRRLE